MCVCVYYKFDISNNHPTPPRLLLQSSNVRLLTSLSFSNIVFVLVVQVDFIPAYVVILSDRPMKPTCTMERHVEGDYVKYNDNWSWCDEKRNTPQAFSHFTWEASGNKLLICDLQGVGDCWTDPQIHTVDGKGFGKGNAGLQGVRQFMRQHKCNAICRALKLQVPAPPPLCLPLYSLSHIPCRIYMPVPLSRTFFSLTKAFFVCVFQKKKCSP